MIAGEAQPSCVNWLDSHGPTQAPCNHAAAVFGDDDANDCNGHGTHNAALLGGLTFGVAKNTTLWSVRAVDCDGTTSVVALLQASGVAWGWRRAFVVRLCLLFVRRCFPGQLETYSQPPAVHSSIFDTCSPA